MNVVKMLEVAAAVAWLDWIQRYAGGTRRDDVDETVQLLGPGSRA